MNELFHVLEKLRKAEFPEDVFDVFGGLKAKRLYQAVHTVFRGLAKRCHPDHYSLPKEKKAAEEAFKLLADFWETAKRKIAGGTYGRKIVAPKADPKKPVVFSTGRRTYTVGQKIADGGMCSCFEGAVSDKKGTASEVLIKVPHDATDNDLIDREARGYKTFAAKLKTAAAEPGGEEHARAFSLRVPAFLETVALEEPGRKEKKKVNIFLRDPKLLLGWHSFEDIRKAYPGGVELCTAVFMWNRLAEALTFAHAAGIFHGAVTPNHMLIHAKSHAGSLIDWSASCLSGKGETLPYLDEKYKHFFPDELLEKSGMTSASSDIFMSAWCMVHILGGDVQEKWIPERVDVRVREFLNKCLQPEIRGRYRSIEMAYRDFRDITRAIFGKRKFVPFVLPVA